MRTPLHLNLGSPGDEPDCINDLLRKCVNIMQVISSPDGVSRECNEREARQGANEVSVLTEI